MSVCVYIYIYMVLVVSVQFSSVQLLSRVQLCDPMNCSTPGLLATKLCPTLVTSWTLVHQAPLYMDSPGKNNGVDCHLDPGIQPTFPAVQVDSLPLSHQRWPYVTDCVCTKSLSHG